MFMQDILKIMICGTRGIKLRESHKNMIHAELAGNELIEGCCKNSPDEEAEQIATRDGIKIHHFPSTKGNYLKRNIEMVAMADEVLAFWDGFSYGTAHSVAQAVMQKKKVYVIPTK